MRSRFIVLFLHLALTISIPNLLGDSKPKEFFVEIVGQGDTIYIKVGEPAQAISAVIHLLSDELLLLDSRCGEKVEDCPNYCNDRTFAIWFENGNYSELFFNLYCNPRCRAISDTEWPLDCAFNSFVSMMFNVNNSSTIEFLGKDWKSIYRNYRPFYGNSYKDILELSDVLATKTTTTRPLIIKNFKFSTVMLGDSRLFLAKSPLSGIITGMFGLAPGPNSFVNQLFQINEIPRPLLSFSGFNTKYFRKGMLVGALDEVSCTNWHQYPSFVRNSWALKAEIITFMGTRMFFNNTVNLRKEVKV
ncbi:hypothetical protein M3Y96_00012400 [Aphelenchoides besseyi]|nr:hypothetical protein M3Y96_00012400 [Aphelenchoides besseyi]